MFARVSLIILIVVLFLLQGCVAVQSFPNVARAGDPITLALGNVDGLDKSTLQVQYVPQSTSIPIDLTSNIRSVLKIYPDRASTVSLTDAWVIPLTSVTGHAIWMNIAVIDLPASLPTGLGYFQVQFSDNVRVADPNTIQSAETVNIATEILASTSGSSPPNTFSYHTYSPANPMSIFPGDFSKLEALPQVVLRPMQHGGYTNGVHPAAAEYRIQLPVSGDIQYMDDSEVHVYWNPKPGEDNKQIQLSWHRQANILTVNVLVPTSLTIVEQRFNFSIVIDPFLHGNKIDINGVPQLLSYRYFDQNGNELTPAYTPEVVVMK